MPLTLAAQIAQDATLQRLEAQLAAAPRGLAAAGRRGEAPLRLDLFRQIVWHRRRIADAWKHGEGSITREEGEALAVSLNDHARAQGRSASATVVDDGDGPRIVFSGARTSHGLMLTHSTPDRVWAHWRGYLDGCPPCRPTCPFCETARTSDCADERRCDNCGRTWTIDGIKPPVQSDAERIRRHKRRGETCYGPEEIERCPRHPAHTRLYRWTWPRPQAGQRHIDLIRGGDVEITRGCLACQHEAQPRGRGVQQRILGIPIGRTIRRR